jgi:hypothetical protein
MNCIIGLANLSHELHHRSEGEEILVGEVLKMDTTSDLFSDGTHPHSLGEATRTVHPHDISFLV